MQQYIVIKDLDQSSVLKKDDTNYNICISDNFLSNISTTSKKSVCYKVDEEYELNFGEKDFIIKELEIYKLDLVNY